MAAACWQNINFIQFTEIIELGHFWHTVHVLSAHHCVNTEEECSSSKELRQSFPLVVSHTVIHSLESSTNYTICIHSLHRQREQAVNTPQRCMQAQGGPTITYRNAWWGGMKLWGFVTVWSFLKFRSFLYHSQLSLPFEALFRFQLTFCLGNSVIKWITVLASLHTISNTSPHNSERVITLCIRRPFSVVTQTHTVKGIIRLTLCNYTRIKLPSTWSRKINIHVGLS